MKTVASRGRLAGATSVTTAVLTALYGIPSDAATAVAEDSGLQEIVVTATRRAVSAQDLPISITAVSGKTLEEGGIEDVAELAHTMAGVDYTDKGPFSGASGANLIIRGLNSDSTGWLPAAATPIVAPVATYVDDTSLFVNLRLQDLDRVEVLRGPQGTLYGSGSLGGTIRFVQNAPDPKAFDAKVELGAQRHRSTRANAPNEDVSGMLNIPLITDTFAVRMNAGVGRMTQASSINRIYTVLDSATGAALPAAARQPVQSAGDLREAITSTTISIAPRALSALVEAERGVEGAAVLLLSAGHRRRISLCSQVGRGVYARRFRTLHSAEPAPSRIRRCNCCSCIRPRFLPARTVCRMPTTAPTPRMTGSICLR